MSFELLILFVPPICPRLMLSGVELKGETTHYETSDLFSIFNFSLSQNH